MASLFRYQIFLSYGILVLALWYSAILNKAKLISDDPTIAFYVPILSSLPYHIKEGAVDYFPLVVLFGLAIYAIASIAIGVANFSDCPEAAAEVEKQIEEAKADMKKRGII